MKSRVAISGKIASGKTTASEYLVESYGYQRVSFSTPFKWIVETWFRQNYRSMRPRLSIVQQVGLQSHLVRTFKDRAIARKAYSVLIEEIFPRAPQIDWTIEKNPEWRALLQDVGNTLRDRIDPDIWVKAFVAQIHPDQLYVCDDVRYPNEYDGLESVGFTIIRLDISPEEQDRRIKKKYGALSEEQINHISETALDSYPFTERINADAPLSDVLNSLSIMTQMGDVDERS